MHNFAQSLHIGQNSDEGISNSRIFGQSFIKKNCHNSRIKNSMELHDMKVTEIDKRNKALSKKIDDDVMSANSVAIVIFFISGHFGVIWKPDSGCMACIS